MLGADYSERGGLAASRATSNVHSPAEHFPSHSPATLAQGQPSTSLDDTESSTWSSLGQLTANTSTTNLPPTDLSHIAASNTKSKNNDVQSSNLDLSTPDSLARDELLRNSTFADWDDHDNASTALDNPDELQKQDPLGTQIWKLYSRTKSRLPNQERMENLTWRMMAMNLRRREQQMQAQAAYEKKTQPGSDLRQAGADSLPSAKQTKLKSPPPVSGPSGIAQQLRRSIDQPVELELTSEPMNLDDFIVPSSIASPAGITSPAPNEGLIQNKAPQGSANIRITPRNKRSVQIPMNLPPSSMPQSSVALNRSSEFDYVQRRVRKTSIDERRGVSFDHLIRCVYILTGSDRTASDLLNSPLKCLPLLYQMVQQVPTSTRVSQIIPSTNPPLRHFPIKTISKAKCLSI